MKLLLISGMFLIFLGIGAAFSIALPPTHPDVIYASPVLTVVYTSFDLFGAVSKTIYSNPSDSQFDFYSINTFSAWGLAAVLVVVGQYIMIQGRSWKYGPKNAPWRQFTVTIAAIIFAFFPIALAQLNDFNIFYLFLTIPAGCVILIGSVIWSIIAVFRAPKYPVS